MRGADVGVLLLVLGLWLVGVWTHGVSETPVQTVTQVMLKVQMFCVSRVSPNVFLTTSNIKNS